MCNRCLARFCLIVFIFSATRILKSESHIVEVSYIGEKSEHTAYPLSHLDFISSNLPVFIIDTHGQMIKDDIRIIADMGIIYNGEGNRNALTDPYNHYNGRINIELRGSSSQQFPKKQYAFETQDSLGNNLNVSFLGMPEENDWILYAPYSDKSLMRNVLIYQLSNKVGRYASRTRFCELILNDEYMGVYVLMEKIKRDKNRVSISKLTSDEISGDDLTGGYIIKIDKMAGENIDGWYSIFPPYLNAPQRILYQYHYPKADDIITEQQNYIQDVIYNFEQLMFSSEYADPVNGYPISIDVDSFVDYFILNELAKNVDAYRLSTFIYKDKDSINGKLFMGPIWDFNLAFGNADYYSAAYVDGFFINYLSENANFKAYDGFQMPFWWKKLIADQYFSNKLYDRWQELRGGILKVESIFHSVDSLTVLLDESKARNFARWPILGTYIWPNAYIGQTYKNEIDYLKQWIDDRINWMDENMYDFCNTCVSSEMESFPKYFSICHNYPNPFNPYTEIVYDLFVPCHVNITIFNSLGNKIRTLVNDDHKSGHYKTNWQAIDQFGRLQPSGVYYLIMKIGYSGRYFKEAKKLILIK